MGVADVGGVASVAHPYPPFHSVGTDTERPHRDGSVEAKASKRRKVGWGERSLGILPAVGGDRNEFALGGKCVVDLRDEDRPSQSGVRARRRGARGSDGHDAANGAGGIAAVPLVTSHSCSRTEAEDGRSISGVRSRFRVHRRSGAAGSPQDGGRDDQAGGSDCQNGCNRLEADGRDQQADASGNDRGACAGGRDRYPAIQGVYAAPKRAGVRSICSGKYGPRAIPVKTSPSVPSQTVGFHHNSSNPPSAPSALVPRTVFGRPPSPRSPSTSRLDGEPAPEGGDRQSGDRVADPPPLVEQERTTPRLQPRSRRRGRKPTGKGQWPSRLLPDAAEPVRAPVECCPTVSDRARNPPRWRSAAMRLWQSPPAMTPRAPGGR